jgi:hypothetical protein
MPLHRGPKRTGVALVELLLVIVLMAILVGLVVPFVRYARREEARPRIRHNLGLIALGTHRAHDTYKKFPPHFGFYPKNAPDCGINAWKACQSLFVHILPYLEENAIYDSFTAEADPPTVNGISPPALEHYLSEVDPTTSDGTNGTQGITSYLANRHAFATSVRNPEWSTYTRMPRDFPSGTSTTIFFVQAVGVPADPTAHVWTGATAWFADAKGNTLPRPLPNALATPVAQQPYQLTPGGIAVAMGDASTRCFAADMPAATWASLCDRTLPALPPPDWKR